LHKSYQASFIASQCNSRGGEAVKLHRHGKRCSKNDFTRHPTPHMMHPISRGNTATIAKMDPTIAVGSVKAQGSKVRPDYGSEPPRAIRARDEVTQSVANILVHPAPHRGDSASSSFISEFGLGCFHHAPLWAGIEPSGFSAWITRE
jgi:hypothetical protein